MTSWGLVGANLALDVSQHAKVEDRSNTSLVRLILRARQKGKVCGSSLSHDVRASTLEPWLHRWLHVCVSPETARKGLRAILKSKLAPSTLYGSLILLTERLAQHFRLISRPPSLTFNRRQRCEFCWSTVLRWNRKMSAWAWTNRTAYTTTMIIHQKRHRIAEMLMRRSCFYWATTTQALAGALGEVMCLLGP